MWQNKDKLLYALALHHISERSCYKRLKKQCLTVSFDECLNTDFQKEQMDIIVHYLHEDRVATQYFDSQFLGHTTADDLLNSLKTSLSKLNNRKVLQISMDRTRVNLKLFSMLCEER